MAQEKLPRYQISVNPEDGEGEELGMTQIAYTATPAIVTRGMAFNLNKAMVFADELKYRLAAPAMIPDMPIYREDPEMGAYEVVFSKEVIEKLRSDFMAKKAQAQFNIEHNAENEAPSYILDSWITGPSETDPSFTKYGIEVPEGSWFVVSQFTDKEFFKNEIIGKDRIGYSIEGFLGLSFDIFTQITQTNKNEKKMKLKFEMARLADGTPIYVSKLEVGAEVKVMDENGESVPVFDAEHVLENGDVVVTVDGKITEIKPKAEAEMAEEAPVAEEAIVEEVVAEVAPVASAIDEAAVMAIIQPKLDELIAIIAELKSKVEEDSIEDIVEVAMTTKPATLADGFAAFKRKK
jgi:hypothetical protein